jgi:hypothetical protein
MIYIIRKRGISCKEIIESLSLGYILMLKKSRKCYKVSYIQKVAGYLTGFLHTKAVKTILTLTIVITL